ncbi:MAG: ABC transporter substrate-binding protein [Myxococcota bacterium]
MPRTFKATIALIITLIVLTILTFINVWQTNSTQATVIKLRQKVEALADSNADIRRQLDKGVSVAGGGSAASVAGGKYADALNDPDNFLEAPTKPMIPAGAEEGGTLRRRLNATPKGFNWLTENGADVSEIQRYAHNMFARRDHMNPDKFIPELAYKIEVNDDFTEYVFHLREGVMWHVPQNLDLSNPKYQWLKKPREVTAEDAVFYFEMVTNPQVQAGAIKNYYEQLESAEVIDKYTFKLTWKEKVRNSLSASIEAYPLPKWMFTRTETGNEIPEETLGTQFNNHWSNKMSIALGTGPYMLNDYEADKRIELVRNEDYWGPMPPIDTIEYRIIKDAGQAFTRVRADELDFTSMTPPDYEKFILEGDDDSPFKTGKLEHRVVERPVYYYVGWNMEDPKFSDAKVRTAMTHAFNRKAIVRDVLKGLGKVTTGPFLPDHPANNPKVEPYPYDLEKAEQLLEEAGWKDIDDDGIREKTIDGEETEFKFTMLAYNKPTARKYLAIFKEDLRKIGVIMNPSPVDWSMMQKKMDEGKFDAFTGGWALGWEIDPYQIWHSSQAEVAKGSNRVAFKNERADEIIETLRKTFDEDKRIELLREFHMILHEEQPYSFFYSLKQAYAWQPALEHVVFQKVRPVDISIPWYIDNSKRSADREE